jgi:hypothetical protein
LQERFDHLLTQLEKAKEEEAKEEQYKALYLLSEAATRATTQYRNAMDMQCLVTDAITSEQMQEMHELNRKQALKNFEKYLAVYPLETCKPYIEQAKQVC